MARGYFRHGLYRHWAYRAWFDAKYRVGMCEEWQDFAKFVDWLGDRRGALSRRDTDLPHSPDNTMVGAVALKMLTRKVREDSGTGIKGVATRPRGRYMAHICIHGQKRSKTFETKAEAVAQREAWECELHAPVLES